jgi:integrase/recombinase XerC
VRYAAKRSKNKKALTVPLRAEVALMLRSYFVGKLANKPVWPGAWKPRAAEMIRIDLEPAGIPYAVQSADGPQYADFHCLRHSYLTLLGRSGVDLRTAQLLADHSSPVLTARYSHRNLDDLTKAVGKLPQLTHFEGAKTESNRVPELYQKVP